MGALSQPSNQEGLFAQGLLSGNKGEVPVRGPGRFFPGFSLIPVKFSSATSTFPQLTVPHVAWNFSKAEVGVKWNPKEHLQAICRVVFSTAKIKVLVPGGMKCKYLVSAFTSSITSFLTQQAPCYPPASRSR
jgi:hypothetical protein